MKGILMKRLIRNILYFAYLAVVLARASLGPVIRQGAAKEFPILLPALFSIAVCVVCTLIIITRTHLLQYSRVEWDPLLNLAFAALSAFLLIWDLYNTGDLNALLVALLTENIWDFFFLLFKKKPGRSG